MDKKASKALLKETKSFNINDTETHQVVVRLGDIVGSGSNQSLFESSPIIVTFKGSPEDITTLHLQSVAAPKVKNLIVHQQLILLANQVILLQRSGCLKQEGLFPSANVVNDLSTYNASGATASVAAFSTAAIPTSMPVASASNAKINKGKVVVQGENVAEQQLQYWFQQADKETQIRFLNWAKSHN